MEEYQDRSLGGRVFKRLREDILKGRYKQQDELREATIGKELGVSRTPVSIAGIAPKQISPPIFVRLANSFARTSPANTSTHPNSCQPAPSP